MVFGGGPQPGALPRAADGLSSQESKLRTRYLLAVKRDVIDRFEASLHNLRYLDLGIAHDPAAVRPPWGYYNPELKRSYANVLAAFESCDRSLLLLGHPGAGKTTALLHLATELIRSAETSDDAPIPVIVNLSKFRLPKRGQRRIGISLGQRDSSGENGEIANPRAFEDWFVAEMAAFPGLDRATAREWLRAGRIAALLDGLDEFNDEQRGELATTLNKTFLRSHADIPIVICSRTNEYEVLRSSKETLLQMTGSVELQSLTDDQVSEYLHEAEAEALLEALPKDASLRELSRTPLTLSMLVLAYGGKAPAGLVKADSLSQTRFRLFQSYVQRMLQRQARRDQNVAVDDVESHNVPEARYRCRPDSIDRWFGWLALTLSVRMRTTFAPRSLVGTLLVANEPQRQLLNFWVSQAAIGIVMVAALLGVALAIAPWTIAAVPVVLTITIGAWIALPPTVAGAKGWGPGLPFIILATGFSIIGGVGIASNALAAFIPGGVSATAIAPLLIGAIVLILMIIADEGFDEDHFPLLVAEIVGICAVVGFSYFTDASRTTIAALSIFPDASSVLGWVSIFAGFGVFVKEGFDRTGWIVLPVMGLLVAASFHAVTLVTTALSWELVLALIASSFLCVFSATSTDSRRAVTIVAGNSVLICAGGAAAGPPGAALAALLLPISLISLEGSVKGQRAAFLEAGNRGFRVLDRIALSGFAWFALASFRRVPHRSKPFLKSAVDAFLLKRSMNDYEFVHRLLRDYFALRELMPRLAVGDAGRLDAIRALGYQGESAVDLLVEFANESDPSVRAVALTGLGHIPSPVSTRALEAALADQDPGVRRALIESLATLSQDERGRLYSQMVPLGDGSEIAALLSTHPRLWRFEGRIIDFVKRMGDSAIEPLISALKHGDAFSRQAAASYMSEVRDQRVADALIEQLRNRNAPYRRVVAESLRAQRNPSAIESFESLLKDRDRSIRATARTALGELYRL